jgi:hypothetical protein
MPKEMYREFLVRLKVPDTASAMDAAEYVLDAVNCWVGCFHNEDPMYHLDHDSIKVFLLRQNTIIKENK